MIIEYNVDCFERILVIKCDNTYAEHVRKINHILDKAYYEWHSPEDIEDPVEQKIVNDSCCEEHMMSRLQEIYPDIDKDSWDTFYYGDDENEMAEDMERHQYNHNYNMKFLNNTIEHLEDRGYKFEPFEKLGNEAYWIVEDCIKKLKELREQYAEEEM